MLIRHLKIDLSQLQILVLFACQWLVRPVHCIVAETSSCVKLCKKKKQLERDKAYKRKNVAAYVPAQRIIYVYKGMVYLLVVLFLIKLGQFSK